MPCAMPDPEPLSENAIEDIKIPKKTPLQHPETCVENGYSPQVQGRQLGQV